MVGQVAGRELVAACWAFCGSGVSGGRLGGPHVSGARLAPLFSELKTSFALCSRAPTPFSFMPVPLSLAPAPQPHLSYFRGMLSPPSPFTPRPKCALSARPLAPLLRSGENGWQFSAFGGARPRRDRAVAALTAKRHNSADFICEVERGGPGVSY